MINVVFTARDPLGIQLAEVRSKSDGRRYLTVGTIRPKSQVERLAPEIRKGMILKAVNGTDVVITEDTPTEMVYKLLAPRPISLSFIQPDSLTGTVDWHKTDKVKAAFPAFKNPLFKGSEEDEHKQEKGEEEEEEEDLMGDMAWAKTTDFSRTMEALTGDLLDEVSQMKADADAAGVDTLASVKFMGAAAQNVLAAFAPSPAPAMNPLLQAAVDGGHGMAASPADHDVDHTRGAGESVTFLEPGPIGMTIAKCANKGDGKEYMVIDEIAPGKQADHMPQLRVGLILKSVNGENVKHLSVADVLEIMRQRPVSCEFVYRTDDTKDEKAAADAERERLSQQRRNKRANMSKEDKLAKMKVKLLEQKANQMKSDGITLPDETRYGEALAFIKDEQWVAAAEALVDATSSRVCSEPEDVGSSGIAHAHTFPVPPPRPQLSVAKQEVASPTRTTKESVVNARRFPTPPARPQLSVGKQDAANLTHTAKESVANAKRSPTPPPRPQLSVGKQDAASPTHTAKESVANAKRPPTPPLRGSHKHELPPAPVTVSEVSKRTLASRFRAKKQTKDAQEKLL